MWQPMVWGGRRVQVASTAGEAQARPPLPPTGFAEGTPGTQPHLSEYSSATNGTDFSPGLGTCAPGAVQGCSLYILPLKALQTL